MPDLHGDWSVILSDCHRSWCVCLHSFLRKRSGSVVECLTRDRAPPLRASPASTLISKNINEALPGVLGNRGNRAFISGEQRPNFEGNRGTKTILGNREHKKTNFRFLGNRGTSQFISGEQGNRYPPGRASLILA